MRNNIVLEVIGVLALGVAVACGCDYGMGDWGGGGWGGGGSGCSYSECLSSCQETGHLTGTCDSSGWGVGCLCSDGPDAAADGGCTPTACAERCRGFGYTTGACLGSHCQCSGSPDADADSPAEADWSAEADVEADADAGADAEGEGDADGDPDCESVPGTWVTIEPGTFQMGSPATEPGHTSQETQHSVTLTHRFEILSTEVTQAQFQERMGYNPSSFTSCGCECPVEQVTWHEAAAYCNELSAVGGLPKCFACSGSGPGVTCDLSASYPDPYACPGYRLPTEAEWEYAARAGTTTATYNGTCDVVGVGCRAISPVLEPIAWLCGNSGGTTHAAGTRDPNTWGLYDMLGNVFEWCHDAWDGSDYPPRAVTDPWGVAAGPFRQYRGGAWIYDDTLARAAQRERGFPEGQFDFVGFRPARTLP